MILILDNYDSFTYNLNDYFLQQGVETVVIRNDEVQMEKLDLYDGIVISPGPGIPNDAGMCLAVIDSWNKLKPMFGVCLGLQAIGRHFEARLIRSKYPMHGKVSNLRYNSRHPMFKNIKEPFTVCRYHSLIIEVSPHSDLNITARSSDGEIMAIAHNELPIWAVQFHPEAILSDQGMQIIRNWVKHFNLH